MFHTTFAACCIQRALLCIGLFFIPIIAQNYKDTLCFTIALNQNPNSLFLCSKGEDLRKTLAGPVLMDGPTLLFYSNNGYVLYRPTGALVDSQSVFKENKNIDLDNPQRLKCAYPLDEKTMIYFKQNAIVKDSFDIFQKTLFKKGLSRLTSSGFPNLKDLNHSQLFNLARSGIVDEMAPKSFLMPNLVGYSSLSTGKKWWSLDKFYSFLSPIIVMDDKNYQSFFPGILPDQKTNIEKQVISPLGTYWWQGKQYYFGVHSVLGSTSIESEQTLILCDQSGNVLFNNQLMKQVLIDDVLEHDKKSNTDYTVKRFWQYVSLPAVEENGDVYYGICDYRNCTIEVHKRMFLRYIPKIVEPGYEALINAQKRFSFNPAMLQGRLEKKSSLGEIGEISIRDDHGKRRRASVADCTCKGYYVVFNHEVNGELKKRLAFNSNGIPFVVKNIRDSLARLSTAANPYCLTIKNKENETIKTLHYGPGDDVLAVRVIQVDTASNIYVRVDLKKWAEIVVCAKDGSHIYRFTFNQEDSQKRKDIIAVSDCGEPIEEDYEHIQEDYTYVAWKLSALREKI